MAALSHEHIFPVFWDPEFHSSSKPYSKNEIYEVQTTKKVVDELY
jgi:hypothetical protein